MNEWISVKDKLPLQNIDNSSRDCLIAIKYGDDMQGEPPTLCTGYLLNNEWWAYQDHNCHKIGDGIYKGDKITHWMPLPKPQRRQKMQGDRFDNWNDDLAREKAEKAPLLCYLCGKPVENEAKTGDLCNECYLEKQSKEPHYINTFLEYHADMAESYYDFVELYCKDRNLADTFEKWLGDNAEAKECYFAWLEGVCL